MPQKPNSQTHTHIMSGKSELCIFDKPIPQISIEQSSYEIIHPQVSIQGQANIKFDIAGSDMYYLDLNDTLLVVELTVTKANNANTADNDNIIPTNYMFYTLFKDVSLRLNSFAVEGTNDTYMAKSLIDVIMNYNKDTEDTCLAMIGYDKTDNNRKGWVTEGKTLQMCGHINLDFFNQPKLLIPGVDVHLTLQRNSNELMLNGAGKVVLKNAKLFVKRVKVRPSILASHLTGLNRYNAVYPIRKTRLIVYSVAAGTLNFFKDQIFGDMSVPKFILITFQKTSTYNGTADEDVSIFGNMNVASIALHKDVDYYHKYEQSFKNNGNYMTSYVQSLILNMGLIGKSGNVGITPAEFKSKYPFFTFVLAPDYDFEQRQLPRQGNVRIDVRFEDALASPINVLVYGIFDGDIEITKSGLVIV